MIKLSIDSSTKKTGIAVWDDSRLLCYFLIDCSEIENIDIRFIEMAKKMYNALEKYKPSKVYIEEAASTRNAIVQRFLVRLQGIVFAWKLFNECEIILYRPQTWRKACDIKQGRNVKRSELKKQAIDFVKNKFEVIVNDDVAEAICIGVAANILDK